MSTMKDVGDRIARFRAESPDFEDGSYSGATVFDFLDELQDRLEALAQPGAVGDCRKAGPGKGLCDRCAAAADQINQALAHKGGG